MLNKTQDLVLLQWDSGVRRTSEVWIEQKPWVFPWSVAAYPTAKYLTSLAKDQEDRYLSSKYLEALLPK